MSCDAPVLTVVGKLCHTSGVNAVQVGAVAHGADIVLHGLWETRFLKGCHTERSFAVRQADSLMLQPHKQDATWHRI